MIDNFFQSILVHIMIYIFRNFTLPYNDNDDTVFLNTIMNGNYIYFKSKMSLYLLTLIVLF